MSMKYKQKKDISNNLMTIQNNIICIHPIFHNKNKKKKKKYVHTYIKTYTFKLTYHKISELLRVKK
ncbi:hypothetical protein PFFVO_02098 [Plasmodium falciparum Vietnam Oak-Knoll (FVO)]|uniref:Uncharacterized protein n=1 Tax=Plasmodium falciparum Vietnam Oak-Knoll (FVO) TaxID=1036723 RepID=A0A024V9C9_PLAFA|nr:hypothetical protein PFFVO_02098 [Plasmodium falciparum Vietnam Oak-Knoll (FVO)]